MGRILRGCGFTAVVLCLLALLGYWLTTTQAVRAELEVFSRGVVLYDAAELHFGLLEGFSMESPTSLRFGPEGDLYVADRYGAVARVAIQQTAPGRYIATAVENISLIQQMPNHDDDGVANAEVSGRLITGIAAAGSADRPALLVASSDPRLDNPDADSNSGVISRLERDAGGWSRTDLVRGLPRSHSDHATNGLHLDEERGLLYVSQGSNTNAGAPAHYFFELPEYALSSAVLQIDLRALGSPPYDLPTLAGNPNGPFGGRRGANQSVLKEGGPVQLFATGIRNAYRIAERHGTLFVIDNGPNPGYGGPPEIVGGVPANRTVDGGEHLAGVLLELKEGAYYGHPNPTRASRRNQFDGRTPVKKERPEEGLPLRPGDKPGELAQFWPSVNGLATYESNRLGSEWNEAFVAVGFDRRLRILSPQPARQIAERFLVEQAGEMPLDVATRSDAESFPGTIWVADYGSGRILVIEPVDPGDWPAKLSNLPRRALTAVARLFESRNRYDTLPPSPPDGE